VAARAPVTSARDEVLARVRTAIATSGATPPVARRYRGPSGRGSPELFCERLLDYRAIVQRVGAGEVPERIAASLARRGAARIVVPEGVPTPWIRDVTAEVLRDDPQLSTFELDEVDGVITTCDVAIAETGTIVLTHGSGQGRRALSLVPDYHLVVVREDQVVGGVPDAVAAVAAPTMTWISGPSATSDIELRRVEGVHGPRTLEVLLIAT